MKLEFRPVRASLRDLLGPDYVKAVCAARAFATGESERELRAVAENQVDFFPRTFQRRLHAVLSRIGQACCPAFEKSAAGATTRAFSAHTQTMRAPLTGFGFFRIGEDGRLYFTLKSEHYHAPLGHSFPGYALLESARNLGIPNATHNNTRGHITRLLEGELVRTAAGLRRGDKMVLGEVLRSSRRNTLNRVLNLETGTLAAEAALKMMLARFYTVQEGAPPPRYLGDYPVFLVIGDDEGELRGNYHGTTITAQTLRGMWSEMRDRLEQATYLVRAVRPNSTEDLEKAFHNYSAGPLRIAGFIHELIMMNYGGRRLSKTFIRRAYALCRKHDVPTLVDEIQSCLWSPELYLFREYGIRPTFVAIGKGFPGGEYPASRILFSSEMDSLPQFGALVTNGQEELASLAYLVTMRWAEANAAVTRSIGESYHKQLRGLAKRHPKAIRGIEGERHLSAISFHDLEKAKAFVEKLSDSGFDISVQTYKAACPPCALTKLPLIADFKVVDFVLDAMEQALAELTE